METVSINKITKKNFQVEESFKALRSNVIFSGSDIKVVGLTSCLPNEGKSSVSLNLAVTMAELGKRVIFIDGDLRKSVLLGRYRINKPIKGLTHYLSGLNTMDEIIYSANVDNLHLIFSGQVPPNPSELLDSYSFTRLISRLREEYDYVIIDTPPLGAVIDAAIIAKNCDGMALVIEANSISYKFAQKVKAQLEKTETKILGVILNKVDMTESGYYGKYYGKYYGD
ncbi:MAG: polysaccharide biosynthesis tyrosine autokinase [Clostridiales bacterium]|nr:polysaccharide biosynthesis tyrosine autokinase [Clostridiales bacterium]